MSVDALKIRETRLQIYYLSGHITIGIILPGLETNHVHSLLQLECAAGNARCANMYLIVSVTTTTNSLK